MTLPLERSGLLWWNFACTLILTRFSPRDCQMPFVIGRGCAEVQIQTCPSPDRLLSCLSPEITRKMPTTLIPFGIFWKNVAYTLILTWSSPRDCKMTFIIGRDFAELQILKTRKWPYLLNRVEYCTLILTRCSPRDCQMPFVTGRGCAEVQIQTCPSHDRLWSCLFLDISRKMLTTLKPFGSQAPNSGKKKKKENGPISWTQWNIVMKFCMHIDIDKM